MNTCQLFEKLAEHTWRTIDRTHRNGITFGEDAITSILLDRICMEAPHGIVLEDTRPKESTKGCDFELWIGNSVLGWSRYAVQAKKLDVRTQRYNNLNHVSGTTPQIDILDSYAKANHAFPLYCLYNWSHRPVFSHCKIPVSMEQLGCSVTPSKVIRKAISTRGANNFALIHSKTETLPWKCLVCCPQLKNPIQYGPRLGWSTDFEHHHKNLPPALAQLMERQDGIHFSETRGLFNTEFGLYPKYVAVIEINEESG